MTGAPLLDGLADDHDAQERPLRAHQIKAIDLLRQSLRSGKRRPVLMLPTGAGKTKCAAEIINLALEKGNRVVFTVPAIDLVDQTLRAFYDDGVREMGVMQSDHPETDWTAPVQIASIQTLMRRPLPTAQIVIVDECHRSFGFLHEWMNKPGWENVPFIGLSATPWAAGMGKHWDDLIIGTTTQELIDGGYLSPFRVFAPAHPDLSAVSTVAGDYHEGQLGDAMDKSPLVADIVQTWIERGEGRPTLCFAVNCVHAKHIQEQFLAAGIPCGYQDAYTTKDERTEIRRKFHTGELKVVSNISTLTMGVDWDVRCLILARPTKSEMLFVQIIGRALRTAPEKFDALILDHSDNHLRLGFVTDIHHDRLHTGKAKSAGERKDQEPLPKECPSCHFLRPPKVATCPSCGFKPEPKSNIEVVDGQLEELRPKSKRATPEGFVKFQNALVPEKEFFGMLLWHASDRGYKSGWAANQYREKLDKWPGRGWDRMVEPSYEVASWIRARMLKFIKGKQKAESA